MTQAKPNRFWYRVTQFVSGIVARYLFRPKIIRNELKGKKGPFVVIANHQAALDFINLIGTTCEPMHFVISDCFYNTLPIRGIMRRAGVIPKQQFQTSLTDIKRMRAVLDEGRPLAIYPAGLMCEDGLSTPLPHATYQFLKWTKADVYVARSYGTYFAKPKWAKKPRPGRTYLDVYRLFSKEELAQTELDVIEARTKEALLFDAYRDQEARPVRYRHGDNVQGLEHVLYQCPCCHTEFSIHAKEPNLLACEACGFAERADEYAFLHKESETGTELRYVSDWSRDIYERLAEKVENGVENTLSLHVNLHTINYKRCRFEHAGDANVSLDEGGFTVEGTLYGEPLSLHIPIATYASLPFAPGRHFDLQNGKDIYRCFPDDGRMVMKLVNLVKIFYERNEQAALHHESKHY